MFDQLASRLIHALSVLDYSTASFLGDLVLTLYPGERARTLLGKVLVHNNCPGQAVLLLADAHSDEARYLLATALFMLEKYIDAETVLVNGNVETMTRSVKNVPRNSESYYLLGRICLCGIGRLGILV